MGVVRLTSGHAVPFTVQHGIGATEHEDADKQLQQEGQTAGCDQKHAVMPRNGIIRDADGLKAVYMKQRNGADAGNRQTEQAEDAAFSNCFVLFHGIVFL